MGDDEVELPIKTVANADWKYGNNVINHDDRTKGHVNLDCFFPRFYVCRAARDAGSVLLMLTTRELVSN